MDGARALVHEHGMETVPDSELEEEHKSSGSSSDDAADVVEQVSSKAYRWRKTGVVVTAATLAVAAIYCYVIAPVLAAKITANMDWSSLDENLAQSAAHAMPGGENLRFMLEDRAGRGAAEAADTSAKGPEEKKDFQTQVQEHAYKVISKALQRHMEKHGELYRQYALSKSKSSSSSSLSSDDKASEKDRELIGAEAADVGEAAAAETAGEEEAIPADPAFFNPDMTKAELKKSALPALFPPSKNDIDTLLQDEINKALREQIAQQNAQGIDPGPQPDPNAQADDSSQEKGSTWIDSVTGMESAYIDTFHAYEVDSDLPQGSLVAYLTVKTHLREPVRINGKAYLTKDRTGGFYPFQIRLNNLHTWVPGIKLDLKVHTGWPLVLIASSVPWTYSNFDMDATCFNKGESPPKTVFGLCNTIMNKEIQKSKGKTKQQIGQTATTNMRNQFKDQMEENLPWR